MPELNEDIRDLVEAIKTEHQILSTVVQSLDTAASKVDKEAALREVKIKRLEEQALSLNDQTEELKESNKKLTTFGAVIFAGFIMTLIGLILTGFLVFKLNQDSAERSRVATEQRQTQQQTLDYLKDCTTPGGACNTQNAEQSVALLQRLMDYSRDLNRCEVQTDGNITEYDKCVAKIPRLIPGK